MTTFPGSISIKTMFDATETNNSVEYFDDYQSNSLELSLLFNLSSYIIDPMCVTEQTLVVSFWRMESDT